MLKSHLAIHEFYSFDSKEDLYYNNISVNLRLKTTL